MLLYIPKPLFFEVISDQTVELKYHTQVFYGDNLRILRGKFGKDNYISRTEAEMLAKMLNVQPEQVVSWFHRQRKKGTRVAYKLFKERLV